MLRILTRPILYLLALGCLIGILVGVLRVQITVEVNPQRFGWAGPRASQAAYQRLAKDLPKFAIRGDGGDDPSRRAVLWQLPRLLYGQHIPTMQQPIGCCVGASSAQAAQYLMAQTGEYKPLFPPYTYACGRNAPEAGNGRYGRNPDGSSGIEQATAARLYGFIPSDSPGLPAWDKASASAWAVRMPSQQYQQIGRQHCVRTIARVATIDDARRIIQNYYPFTIASSWGGMDRPPIVDGMRLNHRVTEWAHQMLVIGYQQVKGRPYWYVLNNWGADFHGPPAGDEPPGGFWIGADDLKFILAAGDSWAYSDAVGFPARSLDFSIVERVRKRAAKS